MVAVGLGHLDLVGGAVLGVASRRCWRCRRRWPRAPRAGAASACACGVVVAGRPVVAVPGDGDPAGGGRGGHAEDRSCHDDSLAHVSSVSSSCRAGACHRRRAVAEADAERGDRARVSRPSARRSARSCHRGGMRILVVEDDKQRRRAPCGAASRPRGTPSTSRWTAPRGSGWPPRTSYDALVLDVMLPGLPRRRALCAAARGRRLDADPDAHRAVAARAGGPGARRRRRRLPGQAVLVRRADGPAAGAGAPRRRASGRRCSRSATCGSTRPRTGCAAATRRST